MKKLTHSIIPLVFLGVAIFSIVLIIKPGASIFHFKRNVDIEEVSPYDRHAYRYPINLNTLLFSAEEVLLYEDGQQLERTFPAVVVNKGLGKFSLVVEENGMYFLNFSASDNSSPLTNRKKYTLYFPVVFLSRTTGMRLLGISTLGLVWFLVFMLKSPAQRQSLAASPVTIWQAFDDFLVQEVARVLNPITNTQSLSQYRRFLWTHLMTFTVATAYFYVFMEWLFFVTMPSFMDLMGWVEKLELLLLSSLVLTSLALVFVIIFAGFDLLSSRFLFTTLPIFIGSLIPSIIMTASCLLLVDNFTYTLFKFGIVSSDGIWRYAYWLGFLILFISINSRILKALGLRGKPKPPIKIPRFFLALMLVLLMISAVFALTRIGAGYSDNAQMTNLAGNNNRPSTRPHILLIGSDGLNADNLSLYGYERDTTPVLRQLAQSSMLAENVFANSSTSAGSITSMLTGKPPAQTRVLYPPNILQGADAYQHLPGILRNEGYYTVEIGVPHYVDAYQINLLDGFDMVNDHALEEGEMVRFARELGLGVNTYFTSRLLERIADRILHIFFLRTMENPYKIVTQPVDIKYDRERLNWLLDLIRRSDRPMFVHVHMIGTHGARFSPEQQMFSKGKTQDENWMTDFYDDSILNFDHHIGELLDVLEQTAEFNNTILIIYSDHPMKYDVKLRLPLLIHFPNGEFAGRIKANVQNLDIAPTILDYLGIDEPNWMAGQSLLKGEPPETRLIFSSGTSLVAPIGQGKWKIDSTRIKPPFYQFTFLNVINCQKWHMFDLINLTWSSGDVPGHTMPCTQDNLLTIDQVQYELAEYLSTNGFDISTLPPININRLSGKSH